MEVDAFICDSIDAANGKLYVLGAGWNTILCPEFPVHHSRMSIGVMITVPYTATNQMHRLEVHIEDSDGNVLPLGDLPPNAESGDDNPERKIRKLGGEFNVGRPPTIEVGDPQMVSIPIQIDQLLFERPDYYSVVVSIDGTEMRRLPMRVKQLVQAGPLG